MKSNNVFSSVWSFFGEVKTEMRKVTWPTKRDTVKDTIAVIVISLIVAVFLGGLDFLFTKILNLFIR